MFSNSCLYHLLHHQCFCFQWQYQSCRPLHHSLVRPDALKHLQQQAAALPTQLVSTGSERSTVRTPAILMFAKTNPVRFQFELTVQFTSTCTGRWEHEGSWRWSASLCFREASCWFCVGNRRWSSQQKKSSSSSLFSVFIIKQKTNRTWETFILSCRLMQRRAKLSWIHIQIFIYLWLV